VNSKAAAVISQILPLPAAEAFGDVEMTEPADGRFTVHLLTPGREQGRPWPPRLEGGWLATRGLIITAVVAPA
jgi:hypothetical protein